jgi:UDP-N-acetylmuramate dehydrogenase
MAADLLEGIAVERNAPITTWFGVGGRAHVLAHPATDDEVARCLAYDPHALLLGDGANLLVHERGVDELVISLDRMTALTWGENEVIAEAGVNLPKLITECCRRGLGGIETLGGIPASVGGALVMNAGGAFGQIADAVSWVEVMERQSRHVVRLARAKIAFGYRTSGLGDHVVLRAELALTRRDPVSLRSHLLEVMEYKKRSQPLGANSAGCAFKNPTLTRDVEGLGASGERVSAGLIIDRAGCKGLTIGSAAVSEVHGNFITAAKGGCAADVIALMNEVARRVRERFGVDLHREVAVWGESERAEH